MIYRKNIARCTDFVGCVYSA